MDPLLHDVLSRWPFTADLRELLVMVRVLEVSTVTAVGDGTEAGFVVAIRQMAEHFGATGGPTCGRAVELAVSLGDLLAEAWAACVAAEPRTSLLEIRRFERTFGVQAPPPQPRRNVERSPAPRRPAALPAVAARRAQAVSVDMAGAPSLRSKEAALKEKWVDKLRGIVLRAGEKAATYTLLTEDAWAAGVLLGRGAWRTISAHVRTFEAYEA